MLFVFSSASCCFRRFSRFCKHPACFHPPRSSGSNYLSFSEICRNFQPSLLSNCRQRPLQLALTLWYVVLLYWSVRWHLFTNFCTSWFTLVEVFEGTANVTTSLFSFCQFPSQFFVMCCNSDLCMVTNLVKTFLGPIHPFTNLFTHSLIPFPPWKQFHSIY